MVQNKRKLLKYNPENGWGSYDILFEFATKLLLIVFKYPKKKLGVWK